MYSLLLKKWYGSAEVKIARGSLPSLHFIVLCDTTDVMIVISNTTHSPCCHSSKQVGQGWQSHNSEEIGSKIKRLRRRTALLFVCFFWTSETVCIKYFIVNSIDLTIKFLFQDNVLKLGRKHCIFEWRVKLFFYHAWRQFEVLKASSLNCPSCLDHLHEKRTRCTQESGLCAGGHVKEGHFTARHWLNGPQVTNVA